VPRVTLLATFRRSTDNAVAVTSTMLVPLTPIVSLPFVVRGSSAERPWPTPSSAVHLQRYVNRPCYPAPVNWTGRRRQDDRIVDSPEDGQRQRSESRIPGRAFPAVHLIRQAGRRPHRGLPQGRDRPLECPGAPGPRAW